MADWVASLTAKEVRDAVIVLVMALIGFLVAILKKKKKAIEDDSDEDTGADAAKLVRQLTEALEYERTQHAIARVQLHAKAEALLAMNVMHTGAEDALSEERYHHETTRKRLTFATQTIADMTAERLNYRARTRALEDRLAGLETRIAESADVVTEDVEE